MDQLENELNKQPIYNSIMDELLEIAKSWGDDVGPGNEGILTYAQQVEPGSLVKVARQNGTYVIGVFERDEGHSRQRFGYAIVSIDGKRYSFTDSRTPVYVVATDRQASLLGLLLLYAQGNITTAGPRDGDTVRMIAGGIIPYEAVVVKDNGISSVGSDCWRVGLRLTRLTGSSKEIATGKFLHSAIVCPNPEWEAGNGEPRWIAK